MIKNIRISIYKNSLKDLSLCLKFINRSPLNLFMNSFVFKLLVFKFFLLFEIVTLKELMKF